jgi:uncharacterized repeat protein (TIGR03803 family)
MKKSIQLLFLILLGNSFANGQPHLWGMEFRGGEKSLGVIFRTNADGTGYSERWSFVNQSRGSYPPVGLVKGPNGKFYGVTGNGGSHDLGVLYEYDPATNKYESKVDFMGPNGVKPKGNLLLANNGKLYGIAYNILFEYNILSNILVPKVHLENYSNGFFGRDLIQGADGKLYGMLHKRVLDYPGPSGFTGASTIFTFDISTGNFSEQVDFAYSFQSGGEEGSLFKAGDGNFYALLRNAGYYSKGLIVKYDPVSNDVTNVYDFGLSADGYRPVGNLREGSNGDLFGTTLNGGDNDKGTIFRFNYLSNAYSKLADFDGMNGAFPYCDLTLTSSGKFIGYTSEGGLHNKGTIFEFDPTGTLTKKVDLTENDGANPLGGNLVLGANQHYYGTTRLGGLLGGGVIFDYDFENGVYTKKIDLEPFAFNGFKPTGTLTQASNGKFYGVTSGGGKYASGVLFEFDAAAGTCVKKVDFLKAIGGPEGEFYFPLFNTSPVTGTNGKLYGTTAGKSLIQRGAIYEFDPLTGNYQIVFEFTAATGAPSQGGLIQGPSGKIMGMTNGDTYYDAPAFQGNGTIFEFDVSTKQHTIKHSIGNPYSGRFSRGALTYASNGKLYGILDEGIDYDGLYYSNFQPFLFEFNPTDGSFVKKHSVNNIQNSTYQLCQAANGKIYGSATGLKPFPYDPVSDPGYLFEYEIDGMFTETHSFSIANNGQLPGGLTESLNGKLYGMTSSGGEKDQGVIFEVDQATGLLAKKFDFTPELQNYYDFSQLTPVNTLLLVKGTQVISFAPLPAVSYGENFTLAAIASSGLPVIYYVSDPSIVRINGSELTILKAGTVSITASQAGNIGYYSAPEISRELVISKKSQSIAFDALPSKTFGDSPFVLTASANSFLPVQYASTDPEVASIQGNLISINKAGTVTIKAFQPGNENYSYAEASQILTINKKNQTIIFANPGEKKMGDAPFNLEATITSNLPLSFTSGSDKISILGSQVTLFLSGRVFIKAEQAGNVNYNSATPIENSFCINPPKPSIVAVLDATSSTELLTSSEASGNQWYFNDTEITGAVGATLSATKSGLYKVRVKADDCLSEFSLSVNLIITGIEKESRNSIYVYPNPSSDWLTLTFASSVERQISIYSINGDKTHSCIVYGDDIKLNLLNYSPGLYVIKIVEGGLVNYLKIVKN